MINDISGELRNPAAWNVLVTSATRIPAAMANEVAPKFREPLRGPTARVVAMNLEDLLQHLASDGQEAAFLLASDLLHVRHLPSSRVTAQGCHRTVDGCYHE